MTRAALGLLATVVIGGCMAGPAPVPVGPVAEPLPPWLVGGWVQTGGSGSLSGMQTRRIYRFLPDGNYEYWNQLCQVVDGTCDGAFERGIAAVSGTRLTLSPHTASAEGARSYEYAVMRDPTVGDVQLHFAIPTGTDVFYYTP